jgi:branched-chain amino acid transport system substrate-binding protein
MMRAYRWPRVFVLSAALAAGCGPVVEGLQDCEEDGDCEALGENVICVQPERFCATDPDGFQPDCATLLGDVRDEGAVRLGAVLPLTDARGQPDAEGQALRRALELALVEVNEQGGLGEARFHLRVCDTHGSPERAAEEAEYLGMRGAVALFARGRADTVAVAARTVPAGVLLVGLEASGPEVAALQGGGLLWRAAPDEARVGEVLAGVVAAEALARVAVLEPGDGAVAPLAERFRQAFASSGTAGGTLRTFGVGQGGVEAMLAEAEAFAPEAVILAARGETAATLVAPLAAHERLARAKVFFLGSPLEPRLLEAVQGAPGLREVRGASVRPPTPEQAEGFRWRYRQRFRSEPGTAPAEARAYDALYCTALAAVAAAGPGQELPLTGQRLAGGLSRLVEGAASGLGPRDFAVIRGQLQRGHAVDLEGASGALSFDPATGEERASVEVWRLAP